MISLKTSVVRLGTQEQSRDCDRIILVMAERHSLCQFRKLTNDHQNSCVVVVRGANFKKIVLYQLLERPTLDVFQMEPNVPRFIPHFLTREALTHILPYTAANTRARLPYWDTCHYLSDSLVSHGTRFLSGTLVASQSNNDVLGANNEKGYLAQVTRFLWMNRRPFFFFFLFEYTQVLRKDILIDVLLLDYLFQYLDVNITILS